MLNLEEQQGWRLGLKRLKVEEEESRYTVIKKADIKKPRIRIVKRLRGMMRLR